MNIFRISFLTLFLFTGILIQTQAQSSTSENIPGAMQPDKQSNNYALLVRNFNHLKAAVKTVDMMTEDEPNAVNNFEVVICGNKITTISEHQALIEEALNKEITLTACGMSMNKFSMGNEELPEGVEVVPNGLIRIFELQDKGYKIITM